jgi:hypothetical protein
MWMWKSLMRALLEGLVMSDPVCYMHYLDAKREAERHDEARPYRAPRPDMPRPVEGASRARKEISA